MSALKSKQYLLLAIIGVSAFLATFYVVYAGMIPVQWSREQPSAAVVGATVEVLDPSSMKLYQDEGLSDELTAGETLEFPVPQFQPLWTSCRRFVRRACHCGSRTNPTFP